MRDSGDGPKRVPALGGLPPAATAALLLVLSLAFAGCLAGDSLDQQEAPSDASRRGLPGNLAMEGAEVLRRDAHATTFRWTAPAPVAAGGTAGPGGSAAVETTFTVPADRFLRINVSTAVPDGGASPTWRMTLRDADGDVRCSSRAGTPSPVPDRVGNHGSSAPGDCRIQPVRPLESRETWTLHVAFDRNTDPEATLVARLTLATTDLRLPREVGEVKTFSTDADDGTILRGHVYVPGGPGPHPTLLRYGPYLNNAPGAEADGTGRTIQEGNRTTLPGWMGRILDHGYALALVNVRGTGLSDGCNTWLNPHVDGPDAAQVIDALANRSWSNGKVGMVGTSWPAYTQYAALLEDPEPLEAVVPVSSVLDLWNIWTRHGAPFAVPAPAGYAAFQAQTGTGPGDEPRHLRCPSYARSARGNAGITADGDKTAFWQKRDAYDILDDSDVPMLVTNGLHRDLEGHILQVQGLWPLLDDQSRLLLGPWGHGTPTATPTDGDWWDLALRWLDHHVKGEGPAPATGVVDYQDDDEDWHRAQAWPPPHREATLHLSDGTLVPDPDQVKASTQTFEAADEAPRPTRCTATKALYVSPPLAEDVRLAGRFRANVTVTSTAPNSNFAVHVWALDPVPDCPAPGAGATGPRPYYHEEVSRALSDLRHRGHRTQGEPFPVGEPGIMSLTSDPFATTLEAGQRLLVAASGGADLLSPEDADPVLQVRTGPDLRGRVDLPVVEGRLVLGDPTGS